MSKIRSSTRRGGFPRCAGSVPRRRARAGFHKSRLLGAGDRDVYRPFEDADRSCRLLGYGNGAVHPSGHEAPDSASRDVSLASRNGRIVGESGVAFGCCLVGCGCCVASTASLSLNRSFQGKWTRLDLFFRNGIKPDHSPLGQKNHTTDSRPSSDPVRHDCLDAAFERLSARMINKTTLSKD